MNCCWHRKQVFKPIIIADTVCMMNHKSIWQWTVGLLPNKSMLKHIAISFPLPWFCMSNMDKNITLLIDRSSAFPAWMLRSLDALAKTVGALSSTIGSYGKCSALWAWAVPFEFGAMIAKTTKARIAAIVGGVAEFIFAPFANHSVPNHTVITLRLHPQVDTL